MPIPNDPIILLSYINTQLRDKYKSLHALCEDLNIDEQELCKRLAGVNYRYDEAQNRFV